MRLKRRPTAFGLTDVCQVRLNGNMQHSLILNLLGATASGNGPQIHLRPTPDSSRGLTANTHNRGSTTIENYVAALLPPTNACTIRATATSFSRIGMMYLLDFVLRQLSGKLGLE